MQDSSIEDLPSDKIIQYSNYKESSVNEDDQPISNASKEEYSIINLALMLSNEKKLKDLIRMIKNELQDNIENNRNVLEININDTRINKLQTINVPLNDGFVDDKEDDTHSKHYPMKISVADL